MLCTQPQITYYLYSGNCLYLSNSACHSPWVRGGFIPLIRCQSVIDRPDSVNLHIVPVQHKASCHKGLANSLTTHQSTHGFFNTISPMQLFYLVTPPSTTAPTTMPQHPSSHQPTIFWPCAGIVWAGGIAAASATPLL